MLTRQEYGTVAVEERAIPDCRHHWIIEAANGPISQGECQNCHEIREFSNSIIEAERDY
ncbi:MAG: hypothetical protein J4N89_07210 [Chloroflexi bacterium]|nr:hypothetical protein [Chloroflexota bacterium]MCH8349929.1 hypothetical protein [Chloroflexota bacterium]MCI0787684.1 hypothetical protein [Chloroflexota bacterium]MCI0798690.1 hypothetical protein [Chloroflexota bacterium]MCI0866317.1 hypothetical protein [Chloroflexota bacterium]